MKPAAFGSGGIIRAFGRRGLCAARLPAINAVLSTNPPTLRSLATRDYSRLIRRWGGSLPAWFTTFGDGAPRQIPTGCRSGASMMSGWLSCVGCTRPAKICGLAAGA
jgi:hypothetical protein